VRAVEMSVSGGAIEDLMPGATDWLEEFFELTNDRSVSVSMSGMYIGAIPASSISRVSANYPGEEEAFTECMRAMDAAYLAYVRAPAKDKSQFKVNRSRTFGPDLMKAAGR